MAVSDLCGISNALASDFVNAVASINRKVKALQRFAQIIEQLGNVGLALPDLSSLLPVSAITASSYLSLLQSCPFLNLPPIPNIANIAALQSLVSASYGRLIESLKLHPFNRLGLLQAQADKVIGNVSGAINTGAQFLQCFQAACSGLQGGLGIGFVNNFTSSTVNSQIKTFSGNGGQVLSVTQQAKVTNIHNMIATVKLLQSTTPPAQPVNVNEFRQQPIPTDHPVPPPPIPPIQP